MLCEVMRRIPVAVLRTGEDGTMSNLALISREADECGLMLRTKCIIDRSNSFGKESITLTSVPSLLNASRRYFVEGQLRPGCV